MSKLITFNAVNIISIPTPIFHFSFIILNSNLPLSRLFQAAPHTNEYIKNDFARKLTYAICLVAVLHTKSIHKIEAGTHISRQSRDDEVPTLSPKLQYIKYPTGFYHRWYPVSRTSSTAIITS